MTTRSMILPMVASSQRDQWGCSSEAMTLSAHAITSSTPAEPISRPTAPGLGSISQIRGHNAVLRSYTMCAPPSSARC